MNSFEMMRYFSVFKSKLLKKAVKEKRNKITFGSVQSRVTLVQSASVTNFNANILSIQHRPRKLSIFAVIVI